MHFDMTITLGQAIQIVLLAGAALKFYFEFIIIFREFPPHRHLNGDIYYPKDKAPEPPQAGGD